MEANDEKPPPGEEAVQEKKASSAAPSTPPCSVRIYRSADDPVLADMRLLPLVRDVWRKEKRSDLSPPFSVRTFSLSRKKLGLKIFGLADHVFEVVGIPPSAEDITASNVQVGDILLRIAGQLPPKNTQALAADLTLYSLPIEVVFLRPNNSCSQEAAEMAEKRAAAEKQRKEAEERAWQAEEERIRKASGGAREAAERKVAAEMKAARLRRAAQQAAVDAAVAQLESIDGPTVDDVNAALQKAVALNVSVDAPALAPVVNWLAQEDAVAKALEALQANDVTRARVAVAEARRFSNSSKIRSRLEPVVNFLAVEDAISAALDGVKKNNVGVVNMQLDEALRLGLSNADSRVAKVRGWLANEEAKDIAIASALTGKLAGSTSKARHFIEEAEKLGANANEPPLSIVTNWLAQEAATAAIATAFDARKVDESREYSKEAMRLGVSANDSRIKPVLDWIANEDAKDAAVASAESAVANKRVAAAQRSYDEALRLGNPLSDLRLVAVKKWLANEAVKEAAVVAAVAGKRAGSTGLAGSSIKEAVSLGADLNADPRLSVVVNWIAQEEAVAASKSAWTAKKLSDARDSLIEARKLGVSTEDPRLKLVADWIAHEDAKEVAVASVQSALSAKNVALARCRYDEALRLNVPSSDARLIPIRAWLSHEDAKEDAIAEVVKSLAFRNVDETKSALSRAFALGVEEDDPRLVDVNAFFCSVEVESTNIITVSDRFAVNVSLSRALKLGVPPDNVVIQPIYRWKKKFDQDLAIQKCKECMHTLDRDRASATLTEALSTVLKIDEGALSDSSSHHWTFRVGALQDWIVDRDNNMRSARNALAKIDGSNEAAGRIAVLSSEILTMVAKKATSKHLIEVSNAVLEIPPTLMGLIELKEHSARLKEGIESLTGSLSALKSSARPWKKKSLLDKLSFEKGVPRPRDVALQTCVVNCKTRLIALNLAVADQTRIDAVSHALEGAQTYDVMKAKSRLYDAIVAGVPFEDPRLEPVKAWIVEAMKTIDSLSAWLQQHVRGLMEVNANSHAFLMFKQGVKNSDVLGRILAERPDWLLGVGVNESDSNDIIEAMVCEYIGKAQAAMSANALKDARDSSNSAKKLGVTVDDSRLKPVFDWIAHEDSKEAAVVAAESAMFSKNVAFALSSFHEALRLGVPASNVRLVLVTKWIADEEAKSLAISEVLKSLTLRNINETRSAISRALTRGVEEDDPRLVDANAYFCSVEVESSILVSDLSAVKASMEKALRLGVPFTNAALLAAQSWQNKMMQDVAIQKCKDRMSALDRDGAISALSEAVSASLDEEDVRLNCIREWVSDEDSFMRSSRNVLAKVDKGHVIVGNLASITSEILLIVDRKAASKHLVAVLSAVLEVPPTLADLTANSDAVSESSVLTARFREEVELLTRSLAALKRVVSPWRKKSFFQKLSYKTGFLRLCDRVLRACVSDLRLRIIAFNLAVADQRQVQTVSQALQGVYNYNVDQVKSRLYDITVAGKGLDDARLSQARAWVMDAAKSMGSLSEWLQTHVKGLMEANARMYSSLFFAQRVENPESIAKNLYEDPEWLLKVGVNTSDASAILHALAYNKIYDEKKPRIQVEGEGEVGSKGTGLPALLNTSGYVFPPTPQLPLRRASSAAAPPTVKIGDAVRFGAEYVLALGEQLPLVGPLLAVASKVLSTIDNLKISDKLMKDARDIVSMIEGTVRRCQGRETDQGIIENLSKLLVACENLERHSANWSSKSSTEKFFSTSKFKEKFERDVDEIKTLVSTLQLALNADTNITVQDMGDDVKGLRDDVRALAAKAATHGKRAQAYSDRESILRKMEIDIGDYTFVNLDEPLAFGSTAKVYEIEMKGVGRLCAKVFDLSSLGSKDRGAAFSAFKRELAVIYSCRHPSIVTVWGATTTLPDKLIMIMELFECGTLRKLLDTSSESLTLARKLDILHGVASGLEYLYSRSPPIFHRDLKSSNVLIDDNGKSKLIDFGLSKSDITMKTMSLETKNGRGGLQGTPKYMSPELFEDMANFTQKSDVYSFGILTWEVLTGRVPWEGLNEFNIITKVSLKHERPSPLPVDVDAKLLSLLSAMWHRDPNERPTFKAILEAFESIVC